MNGKWRVGFCLLLLAFGGTATRACADSLEAIPLQHRLAEDLIPVLQPLLPPGAALTGTGDVLLVRADAATVQQIRRALATLDRAPRQLLITVGQSTGGGARNARVQGSATVGSGDAQVGINRPPAADAGAQVTVQAQQTRADIRSVSSVRALEGYEAYVAVGESKAFRSDAFGPGPHPLPVYGQPSEIHDAKTGFYATARLSGDRVVLEVSPSQQKLASEAGRPSVATQSLTTTVSGRLGEWMELGGVADSRGSNETGLITWGTRSELTQYAAWVKVEELP